uniref:Uncharacterized protein n=1 Tax=Plectus sambesii TaxID=2011161 RepID=A0A914VMY6_9BILA
MTPIACFASLALIIVTVIDASPLQAKYDPAKNVISQDRQRRQVGMTLLGLRPSDNCESTCRARKNCLAQFSARNSASQCPSSYGCQC